MVQKVPERTTAVGAYELAIYLVMRSWAKPSIEMEEVRRRTGAEEDVWVYEVNGFVCNPKQVTKYLWSVDGKTQKNYEAKVKAAICTLMCAKLVMCYSYMTDSVLSNQEFAYVLNTPEEWRNGSLFTFYFPVPTKFYGVSGHGIENIVNYCKENKDREVTFFISLFAILEYYFGISVDNAKCWLMPPVSTFFDKHRTMWARIDGPLSAAGIFHNAVKYMDENGEMKTKQIFERKESDSSEETTSQPEDESFYTPDDELPFNDSTPGVEEKPKTSNDHRTATPAEKPPLIGLTTGKVFEPEPYVWKDFATECGYRKRYEEIMANDPFCEIMTPDEMNEQKNMIAKKEWEEEQRKEFAKREVALDMQMKKENAFQSFEK